LISCMEREIHSMKLQRDVFKVVPMNSPEAEDDYVALSPSECLSLVWDLTREVFSLSGDCDVESRLQRDVVTIIKR
jgi:hypothetical protein